MGSAIQGLLKPIMDIIKPLLSQLTGMLGNLLGGASGGLLNNLLGQSGLSQDAQSTFKDNFSQGFQGALHPATQQ